MEKWSQDRTGSWPALHPIQYLISSKPSATATAASILAINAILIRRSIFGGDSTFVSEPSVSWTLIRSAVAVFFGFCRSFLPQSWPPVLPGF
jgi:hypothetical protein